MTENRLPVYHAIIVEPHESRILLVSDGDGWRLPSVESCAHHLWQDPGPVVRRLSALLDIECSMLRRVADWRTDSRRHDVSALELRSPCRELPANARWTRSDEISSITFIDQREKAAVYAWFDWLARAGSPYDVPWYRPGWLDQAFNWITAQLEQQHLRVDRDIEQIRWWNISAVIRLYTSTGVIYFKAVPRMFGYEGAVLSSLGAKYPDQIPRVIARDDGRCWWLLADAGDWPLQAVDDVESWKDALATYARLQIDMISETGRLTALGCPTITPDSLASKIKWLLANTQYLAKPSNRLSAEELAAFQLLAVDLIAACDRLNGLGIPLTVDHGDFHARQIIIGSAGPVFIDWTDARIAHPFFSLTSFLREEGFAAQAGEVAIDFEENQAMLRDAYLEPWSRLVSRSVVQEAYRLTEQLDFLDGALTYVRMLDEMAVPAELEMVPPLFIRMLIEKPVT